MFDICAQWITGFLVAKPTVKHPCTLTSDNWIHLLENIPVSTQCSVYSKDILYTLHIFHVLSYVFKQRRQRQGTKAFYLKGHLAASLQPGPAVGYTASRGLMNGIFSCQRWVYVVKIIKRIVRCHSDTDNYCRCRDNYTAISSGYTVSNPSSTHTL